MHINPVVSVLNHRQCSLGEGPLFSQRKESVLWVDIIDRKLFSQPWPIGDVIEYSFEKRLAWVLEKQDGKWLLGFEDGIARFSPDSGATDYLWTFDDARQGMRLNDAALMEDGSIVFGTMDDRQQASTGCLYHLSANEKQVSLLDSGYVVSNGPIVHKGYLYAASSTERVIYRMQYHPEGRVTDKQVFIRFSNEMGYPDGMVIDDDDHLWVAAWGGSAVYAFSLSAQQLAKIPIPAKQVTNLAFILGEQRQVCVTSAASGLSKQQLSDAPDSGKLFHVLF